MIHVIAKVPLPGHTKTRLIPRLGAVGAAALSAAMADDVVAIVASTGLPWRIVYSGPRDHPWLDGRPACPQVDGDLGDKLAAALVGGGLAVGTDCVLLAEGALREAHEDVASGAVDLVLGAAEDGGYTFVAASRRAVADGVFEGIPWSTAETARAQIAAAHRRGLSVRVADGTFDVDEPADLDRLSARLAALPSDVAPATRRAIGALLAGVPRAPGSAGP